MHQEAAGIQTTSQKLIFKGKERKDNEIIAATGVYDMLCVYVWYVCVYVEKHAHVYAFVKMKTGAAFSITKKIRSGMKLSRLHVHACAHYCMYVFMVCM